jgi:hypothetical protein
MAEAIADGPLCTAVKRDVLLYDFGEVQILQHLVTGECVLVHGIMAKMQGGPFNLESVHGQLSLAPRSGAAQPSEVHITRDSFERKVYYSIRGGTQLDIQPVVVDSGGGRQWMSDCSGDIEPIAIQLHLIDGTTFKTEVYCHAYGIHLPDDSTQCIWISMPWIVNHLYGSTYSKRQCGISAKSWRKYLQHVELSGEHIRDSRRSNLAVQVLTAGVRTTATHLSNEIDYTMSLPAVLVSLARYSWDRSLVLKAQDRDVFKVKAHNLLLAVVDYALGQTSGRNTLLAFDYTGARVGFILENGNVDRASLIERQKELGVAQRSRRIHIFIVTTTTNATRTN